MTVLQQRPRTKSSQVHTRSTASTELSSSRNGTSSDISKTAVPDSQVESDRLQTAPDMDESQFLSLAELAEAIENVHDKAPVPTHWACGECIKKIPEVFGSDAEDETGQRYYPRPPGYARIKPGTGRSATQCEAPKIDPTTYMHTSNAGYVKGQRAQLRGSIKVCGHRLCKRDACCMVLTYPPTWFKKGIASKKELEEITDQEDFEDWTLPEDGSVTRFHNHKYTPFAPHTSQGNGNNELKYVSEILKQWEEKKSGKQ